MPFEIKRNDRRPSFVVLLVADYGEVTEAAIDLTTAGTAYFNMRSQIGGTIRVNRGTAQITNATAGEVTYLWGTADTTVTGNYDAEIEVLWDDLKSETFPGGPTGGSYWTVIITDDIA